jgi:hypothetical protein
VCLCTHPWFVASLRFLMLQILKSAFHPDKVRRHWDNPWIFNTFGFVPITWVVLTVLLGEEIDKAAYSVLLVRILSLM